VSRRDDGPGAVPQRSARRLGQGADCRPPQPMACRRRAPHAHQFFARLPSSPRSRALARQPASSAAHSRSSCFRCRTSLAPAVDRLFADPVPLGHRQHQLAIRLPQDRHSISPSVKRALRIAPSESRASLSRNHWSEIPGPGQRHPAGGSRIGLVTSCVGASLFSSGEICEKPLLFEQQSLRVSHLP
jgi:hypothetical protein